jgi:predicted DNA-binding transcriptional regulator YafY
MSSEDLGDIFFEARDRGVTLAFDYVDADGVPTSRVVDPIRLEPDHFFGWCCHREDVRRFVRDRMERPRLGPSPNEVHLPLGDPETDCD